MLIQDQAEKKFSNYIINHYLERGYSQKGIEDAFLLDKAPFDLQDFPVTTDQEFTYFNFLGLIFKIKR